MTADRIAGAPDSEYRDGIGADRRVEVYATPDREFPESGSITFVLHFSKVQSSTLRITRTEALSAISQLAEVLAGTAVSE